ncbi:dipeptidase [Aureimonas pseudogalii]|uniref:Acetylornithine deacetylase/succinyl-diaminopimelate desuccinylase-like protein n=1 Tax=Aureimonas pseudogalii TaxID=1744844 RepID=A0A7W6ML26_9HYPH|nr:dipeptidase [Aureimonas pseudogalii]MBB3999370.1 acetylornithine deacetylase/succinyl-diaminopimelate desuccinylase-like protein [Aureimonas pseudogalii]
MTADVEAHCEAHRDAWLEELKAFCRIPSVSTDPAYREDVLRAAGFLAERMRIAGLENVRIEPTGGSPLVLADWLHASGAPTVLVYGHYDVQPPDPLAKWTTPPFEPTVRDDRLYARGVSDDKGPMLMTVFVAEAFLRTVGRLPVNLKFVIEGEEETGSPHFEGSVERLREELAADVVVSADGAMWRADRPSVTVASRGLAALDVTLHGAGKDLHSGRHGGAAPNAVAGLVRLLATLHDADGAVAVEGFAAGVTAPDPALLDTIRSVRFDAGAYFREIGASAPEPLPDGEALLLRQWLTPTLEFNGISGGYAGAGTKTVIPAEASAKITCRLVAGQEPDAVVAAIVAHLERHCPPGYRLETHRHGPGSPAFALDPALPALEACEAVLTELLGQRPVRVAMGATVPIGAVFRRHLERDPVFFSFSTADEDYHAPNEFFRLASFRTGLVAWTRLLARLGA